MIDRLFDGTWIVTFIGADAAWPACDASKSARKITTVLNDRQLYIASLILFRYSWNRLAAAAATCFTAGTGQKPCASTAKTGLNLLRKFSKAMIAANSTSSSSVNCFCRRLKKRSVNRFLVYLIPSHSSKASLSRAGKSALLL